MPIYITLCKRTAKGAANMRDSPERIKKNMWAFEATGGKVTGLYAVMGEYHDAGIGEGPGDEAAVAFSLATSALRNVTTTTLRAFTIDELADIAKRLPQCETEGSQRSGFDRLHARLRVGTGKRRARTAGYSRRVPARSWGESIVGRAPAHG